MTSYLASLDQGTSSTRFIVFDTDGLVVASHQIDLHQIHPHAGWAEHDPQIILDSAHSCIKGAVKNMKDSGLDPMNIKSIGITNQRETTVAWDRKTGLPLQNAIVWLDARTKDLVKLLIDKTPSQDRMHFSKICGLPLSSYFSAVKMRWMLDHTHAVRVAMREGNLMFGTIDSWLIYKLTGGNKGGVHVTDVTNASRTMLMNLKTLKWDDELCDFFDVKKSCLAEIKSSAEIYGHLSSGPLKDIPISGCLGDQQAALVGQLCLDPGALKNTYGTGCFMLCNTGDEIVESTHGLLTTVGYQLGADAKPAYALEGSIAIAGAAVQWLKDNMGIISEIAEVSDLAAQVESSGGIYFVPAFSGLFAPYWRDDARGCIVGMTQFTTKKHLCRAALEQVCYQTRDIMDAMAADTGNSISNLSVDGGLTNSDLMMQIQADIANIPLSRPKMREITAFGSALAAAHAVGTIDIMTFKKGRDDDEFFADMTHEKRTEMREGWKKAVEKSFGWA